VTIGPINATANGTNRFAQPGPAAMVPEESGSPIDRQTVSTTAVTANSRIEVVIRTTPPAVGPMSWSARPSRVVTSTSEPIDDTMRGSQASGFST
jgi:hypothetical protein